jgi:hypothetical protein
MDWASRDKAVERAIDVAAAAIFAAAAAFAAWALAGNAGAVAAFVAAAAFLLACAVLRNVAAEEPSYVLPDFEPVPIELAPEAQDSGAELLLDDRLTRVDPDARVVQLFGPGQGPAAGDRARSEPADASEALSEALAELRRLLR